MVPPCFGSQACLVGISFVSINSRSPNTSILDLTRPQHTASWALFQVLLTASRNPAVNHESHHSDHSAWPGGRVEGGREPRSEFGSSHWKSQICRSLNQEQVSTLTLQLYVCLVCWLLMMDWDLEKEKSWHLTHLFKQNQDSSSAHTQITRSSLA